MKNILQKSLIIPLFLLAQTAGATELQNTTIGAEAYALGGAHGATVDNPSALLWNPAGLANIAGKTKDNGKKSIEEEAENAFSDESFDNLFNNIPNSGNEKKDTESSRVFAMQIFSSYSLLTLDRHAYFGGIGFTFLKGTLGIAYLGTSVNGIDSYNSSGVSTGAINYGVNSAIIGYGWGDKTLKMGVSLSALQENLGGASRFGGGLNVGVQLNPIPIFLLGANIRNLAGVIQSSNGSSTAIEKLPTVLQVSMGVSSPPPGSSILFLIGVESNLDNPDETYFNIGLNMKLTRSLFLMGGINKKTFSLGAQVKLSIVQLTYSVNKDILKTGFQHHVDLNLSF